MSVERVFCEVVEVEVEAYPGGTRPMAVVHVAGKGEVGRGENVSWTLAVQDRFAASVNELIVARAGTVRELVSPEADPYAHAALEAALVDLAMRQAGVSLATIADARDVAVVPVRYLISFDATLDPAARLAEIAAVNPGARFKVDVDPEWSDTTVAELAAAEVVEMLDFKERGDEALVERLATAFPDAWLEDPPPHGEIGHAKIARDIVIRSAADAARWAADGAMISIKAPRMGGVLEALRGLEAARAAGALAHIGGMWELGPGRDQARLLAALYCADAPNDVAPIPRHEGAPREPSPLAIRVDLPGFGPHPHGPGARGESR